MAFSLPTSMMLRVHRMERGNIAIRIIFWFAKDELNLSKAKTRYSSTKRVKAQIWDVAGCESCQMDLHSDVHNMIQVLLSNPRVTHSFFLCVGIMVISIVVCILAIYLSVFEHVISNVEI